VRIATKMPCHDVTTTGDFDRCLKEQLKRLNTEMIDFYLLHSLDKLTWTKMQNLGIIKWADEKITSGHIGYFGFSFHDSFEVFKEIIDSYENWTLCQIQYNYMDEYLQAGTVGLKYAHKKGLAVVVMEPIKGGKLIRFPETLNRLWAEMPVKRTPQEWALRWVWNHPEVTLALSGMSTFEHIVENIGFAEYSEPNNLTNKELAQIEQVRDTYLSLSPVPCSACRYCVPCPNEVDIPRIFEFFNESILFNDTGRGRKMYNDPHMIRSDHRANMCLKCELCVEKCPQKIQIPELLEKAHILLNGIK